MSDTAFTACTLFSGHGMAMRIRTVTGASVKPGITGSNAHNPFNRGRRA